MENPGDWHSTPTASVSLPYALNPCETEMSERMTSEKFDEIEKRAKAATGGPWTHWGGTATFAIARLESPHTTIVGCDISPQSGWGTSTHGVVRWNDAVFIGHSWQDVQDLLAEARKVAGLEAEIVSLRASLQAALTTQAPLPFQNKSVARLTDCMGGPNKTGADSSVRIGPDESLIPSSQPARKS